MESAAAADLLESNGTFRVQVLGAGAEPVPPADLARLFPRLRPFSPRFDRLAIYLRAEDELRVPELAVAPGPGNGKREVLNTLFDALEIACLAGGHRRLIVTPPPAALAMLQRRGYELVREGCAGTWLEKRFQ